MELLIFDRSHNDNYKWIIALFLCVDSHYIVIISYRKRSDQGITIFFTFTRKNFQLHIYGIYIFPPGFNFTSKVFTQGTILNEWFDYRQHDSGPGIFYPSR